MKWYPVKWYPFQFRFENVMFERWITLASFKKKSLSWKVLFSNSKKTQWKRTISVQLVPSTFAKNVPVFLWTVRKISKTVEWSYSLPTYETQNESWFDLRREIVLVPCVTLMKIWIVKVYLIYEYGRMITKYNVYFFVMLCAICYHLYNLKNVKNTNGGVLLLVKLQTEASNFKLQPAILLKVTLLHWCFSHLRWSR